MKFNIVLDPHKILHPMGPLWSLLKNIRCTFWRGINKWIRGLAVVGYDSVCTFSTSMKGRNVSLWSPFLYRSERGRGGLVLRLLFSLLIMSFPCWRLANKVAIDELINGWRRRHKSTGTGAGKMDFCTGSGSNIKFITFPNNGGERKDCPLFSADNVPGGPVNRGFN